jgi:hypothetical protein
VLFISTLLAMKGIIENSEIARVTVTKNQSGSLLNICWKVALKLKVFRGLVA